MNIIQYLQAKNASSYYGCIENIFVHWRSHTTMNSDDDDDDKIPCTINDFSIIFIDWIASHRDAIYLISLNCFKGDEQQKPKKRRKKSIPLDQLNAPF